MSPEFQADFVDVVVRAIFAELRTTFDRVGVVMDLRQQESLGANIKALIQAYDSGRIRQIAALTRLATDAVNCNPRAGFGLFPITREGP